jgi:two-component system, OmpR family, alkaline phosphatase synthesis response regulator PhoP
MTSDTRFRILLVDDELDILEFMSYNIEKAGYDVYTATDGKKAIKIADEVNPHLIILDVMMPEMDGIETCEELRRSKQHENTMIVFLTARSEDYSQIAGFTAGADDYIAKPVRPRVLLSRIAALLRRHGADLKVAAETGSVAAATHSTGIIADRERFLIICEGTEIVLPKKEFELLSLLMSKPDKVFTRDEIFARVWDAHSIVGERTIDVHIRKLREKIGEKYLKTVKGVGYKFTDPA